MRQNPQLKRILRIAHIKQNPQLFVQQTIRMAAMVTAAIGFLLLMFFDRMHIPMLLLLFIVPGIGLFTFMFIMMTPYGIIRKREREINKEVLFAGRYLLVKIESGSPLFNSLIDASHSYGVCSKYFREIVDEINTGTPIEQAIEDARQYNASEKFKKVLWQIGVSIKTGTDITTALRATLDAITQEQVIEIKEYAKKLNSLMMFYLVIACVLPSLGMTLFIIFATFLQLDLSPGFLFFMLFVFAFLQFAFIVMIRASRPMVNI